jgi:hypothetical protein
LLRNAEERFSQHDPRHVRRRWQGNGPCDIRHSRTGIPT